MRSLVMTMAMVAMLAAAEREIGDAYVLYPGDLVDVRVFAQPDLSLAIRVPRQGAVDYPLIGSIDAVAGRTIQELGGEIARRLRDGYLRDPAVTLTVTQYGARTAYVMGAVPRPTAVPLDPVGTLTVLQAIGQAGGFEPDADRPALHVLRGEGDERTVIPVSDDGALQPGDIVVVPRRDRVHVLGQVARPGPYPLAEAGPMTVSRAISSAGGLDRFAKSGSVQVIRAGRRIAVVDLRKVLAGEKPESDIALQAGDTVFVPESRF